MGADRLFRKQKAPAHSPAAASTAPTRVRCDGVLWLLPTTDGESAFSNVRFLSQALHHYRDRAGLTPPTLPVAIPCIRPHDRLRHRGTRGTRRTPLQMERLGTLTKHPCRQNRERRNSARPGSGRWKQAPIFHAIRAGAPAATRCSRAYTSNSPTTKQMKSDDNTWQMTKNKHNIMPRRNGRMPRGGAQTLSLDLTRRTQCRKFLQNGRS